MRLWLYSSANIEDVKGYRIVVWRLLNVRRGFVKFSYGELRFKNLDSRQLKPWRALAWTRLTHSTQNTWEEREEGDQVDKYPREYTPSNISGTHLTDDIPTASCVLSLSLSRLVKQMTSWSFSSKFVSHHIHTRSPENLEREREVFSYLWPIGVESARVRRA